jgi:hypothetical protein
MTGVGGYRLSSSRLQAGPPSSSVSALHMNLPGEPLHGVTGLFLGGFRPIVLADAADLVSDEEGHAAAGVPEVRVSGFLIGRLATGKPITTGLPGTDTSARPDHKRAELCRRGSYHLAMEIREFLGTDSHAKSKKTCRLFEFQYNQLDGNDFLRSIPSDTSHVLPLAVKSTSISAQIFFAYQTA